MRKLFFSLALFISATLSSFAQTDFDKAEIELYQSIFGMEKKSVFADYITIKEENKDGFWKLYDEYELKRQKIAEERIKLLYKYVNRNKTATDEEIKSTMKFSLQTSQALEDLQKKYYKKISKSVSLKSASQFYYLENYFQSVLSIMIIEQLPFIKTIQLKP